MAERGRVTGLGGVFFKSTAPERLIAWYQRHLGITTDQYGASFFWREDHDPSQRGQTVWAVFDQGSDYFAPSDKPFMINFRVDDLDAVLERLRALGVSVDPKIEDGPLGRFAWIMDPEGTRIELWQAPPEQEPAA